MKEPANINELMDRAEKAVEAKSFHEKVWMTLSRIDMTNHISTKTVKVKAKNGRNAYEFSLDYISWVTAWQQLMECFPESHFEFDPPLMFEAGTGEQWITLTIKQGENELVRKWWLPYIDQMNQPIHSPTSTQINNTRMRVLTKCIAMCGLGIEAYGGEDVQDQRQDATPVRSKSVTQTVIDEMGIKADPKEVDGNVAGIKAALFNEDDDGLFKIFDFLNTNADLKILVWRQLDSKERSAITKRVDKRDENPSRD